MTYYCDRSKSAQKLLVVSVIPHDAHSMHALSQTRLQKRLSLWSSSPVTGTGIGTGVAGEGLGVSDCIGLL